MANNQKNSSGLSPGAMLVICIIIIGFFIIMLSNDSGSDSSSSRSKSGEQRCWYCGKVIVNSQGTPIHKSGGKCDYCGKSN